MSFCCFSKEEIVVCKVVFPDYSFRFLRQYWLFNEYWINSNLQPTCSIGILKLEVVFVTHFHIVDSFTQSSYLHLLVCYFKSISWILKIQQSTICINQSIYLWIHLYTVPHFIIIVYSYNVIFRCGKLVSIFILYHIYK